jgi:hypothetical protein
VAKAGFQCAVRRGGVPTTMTAEACTTLSSTRFQVTSAARRCIDPESGWHILVGGATVAYTSITAFDYLFGEFTVASPLASAPTLTATFVPMTTTAEFISEVKGHSLSQSTELLDVTVYTSTSPFRKRIDGLADASLSLDMLLNPTDMARLATLQATGVNAFVEVNGGASPLFRGIGKVTSIERSTSVDGLVEATVEWTLAAARDPATGFIVGYSDRNLDSA